MQPFDFGVYVHWPFCQAKCPYCDFNSHVRFAPPDQDRFVAAFRREIEEARALSGPLRASTVFFGGGTPSLMEPRTVAALLDAIAEAWGIASGAEITLEANPGSVEAGRFEGYRAAGVNRVSIGIQALNDPDLKALGRIHTLAEAEAALAIAARTFPRMSFDLIYARPGQLPGAWAAELKRALAIARGHLSLYQLTIEDGTPFAALHARGRLKVPEPELAAELYALTQELTASAGLPAYEISNHAAPGEESRHNLVYWRYRPYAGLGPGAHGRLGSGGRRLATENVRAPEAWLEAVESRGHGRSFAASLGNETMADEMVMMGLRLTEGLDLSALAATTGLGVAQGALEDLRELDLIEPVLGDRLKATVRGRLVLDAVIEKVASGLKAAEPIAARPDLA